MTATWTTPRTFVAGELITAAIMNAHVRDNTDWLKTPPTAVDTSYSISTTSASLVDVTGSSISLTTVGGGILVTIYAYISGTVAFQPQLALNLDGATHASQTFVCQTANNTYPWNFTYHIPAQSAGSHTIKLQVLTNAGTATVTGAQIYAIELGS